MKNLTLVFVLIGILTISSCDKFIEIEPESEYTFQNMWKNDAEASAGIASIYHQMQITFDRNFVFWGEGRADLLDIVAVENDEQVRLQKNQLHSLMSTTDWNSFYKIISRSNYALKNLPNVDMNGYDRNVLRGQAFFARALSYFWIARVWGNAPLVIEAIDNANMKLDVPQNSSDEILQQVLIDLDSASNNLPERYSSDDGFEERKNNRCRATRAAVWALQADVLMWMKQYDKAIAVTDKFTTTSRYYDDKEKTWKLWPKFEELLRRRSKDVEFPTEGIFEIHFSQEEGVGSGFWGLFEGEYWKLYKANPKLLGLVEEGDERMKIFMWGGHHIARRFAADDARWSEPRDANVVLYRLADIMLLRAEALNKVGKQAEAIELLNSVRARVSLQPKTLEELPTEADVENAILNERAVELVGEGKRYFDLVRTGKAGSELGITDVNNIYWPVHSDNLKANPSLVQNPFYVTL